MRWSWNYILLLLMALQSGCGVIFPATDNESEWSAVWWISGAALVIAIVVAAITTKGSSQDDDS